MCWLAKQIPLLLDKWEFYLELVSIDLIYPIIKHKMCLETDFFKMLQSKEEGKDQESMQIFYKA